MSRRAWKRKGRLWTRAETSTNTRDPSLQTTFADPYGSLTQLGLSVPSAIPTCYPKTPWANRYLFLLASVKFTYGEVGRIVGMRQRVLIGATATTVEPASKIPVYQAQTTPDWHFTDGNISWHLRRVPLGQIYTANVNNAAELMFRAADAPALLYENAPAQAGGYAPPYAGRPPGNVVIPEFGNFHDLRFGNWQDDRAWDSLGMEVMGPCAVNLYASVKQTNPSTRPSFGRSFTTAELATLPPEEAFLQAWAGQAGGVTYTRIAGSIIYETASMFPETLLNCQDEAVAKRKRAHKSGASGRDAVDASIGPGAMPVTADAGGGTEDGK